MVAPLDKIEGAIEANDLKIIRSKKIELLQGDSVFPLASGLEALGNQKPPQLDDQNANVRPAGLDVVEEADLAEYAPSDAEEEEKGSSEPGPSCPPPPEAPRPPRVGVLSRCRMVPLFQRVTIMMVLDSFATNAVLKGPSTHLLLRGWRCPKR